MAWTLYCAQPDVQILINDASWKLVAEETHTRIELHMSAGKHTMPLTWFLPSDSATEERGIDVVLCAT